MDLVHSGQSERHLPAGDPIGPSSHDAQLHRSSSSADRPTTGKSPLADCPTFAAVLAPAALSTGVVRAFLVCILQIQLGATRVPNGTSFAH